MEDLKGSGKTAWIPLLITQSGGAEGGSSLLTPKAKDFLVRFLGMEKELREDAQKLYQKIFFHGGSDRSMKALFEELSNVLAKGEEAVLVTIIASSGSTPRGTGSRMLV